MAKKPVFNMGHHNPTYKVDNGFSSGILFLFFGGVTILAIVFNILMNNEESATTPYIEYLPAFIGALIIPTAISLIMWINHRRRLHTTRKNINALKQDNLLATWTYEANEWQKLVEAQRSYGMDVLSQTGWKMSALIAISVLVFFGGMAFAIEDIPPAIKSLYIALGIFIAVFILGTSIVSKRRQVINVKRTYKRRKQQSQPTFYIGRQGLYHETEGYQSFKNLIGMSIDENEPASLIVTVQIHAPRYGMWDVPLHFPIPEAHKKDAKVLVSTAPSIFNFKKRR